MTSSPKARRRTGAPICLVRWIFHRSGNTLTCQVDASATRSSYDVSVVPHWNVASAAIETVGTPGRALQRHAEIAKHLRETGWLMARRTA
jgi:hypothetical protein